MRLETAIRATPSNPTAQGCPVGLTGFGRRCWARTTESCLSRALCSVSPGPPRRVAPYSPLGWRAWWPARCRWRSANMCRCRVSETARSRCSPRERGELREMPAAELDELAAIYEAKGVSPQTAAQVAAELTAHDALAAHVDAELRLDPDDLANPLQAAAASAASFTVGALLPLPAIFVATSDVSASHHLRRRADRVGAGGCAQRTYRREPRRPRRAAGGDRRPGRVSPTVPVLRCLPQASTLDETPALSSSLVTATG